MAGDLNETAFQFDGLIQGLENYAEFLSGLGISGVECSPETIEIIKKWGEKQPVAPESLDSVRRRLASCRKCSLCRNRTTPVFGTGDQTARLMMVGFCPSPVDDKKGEPFSDQAGALLTNIITAMHLDRSSVYLCNVLKCRPPAGVFPGDEETSACMRHLKNQIRLVRPEIVCLLGEEATRSFLNTKTPFSNLRGAFHDFETFRVMPTWHPKDLLAAPAKKKDTWNDVQKIMQVLGV